MKKFNQGDLVSLKNNLILVGEFDDKLKELSGCKSVRLARDYESQVDLEKGSYGLILAKPFSHILSLNIVFINNMKCIIWNDLLSLVSEYGEND